MHATGTSQRHSSPSGPPTGYMCRSKPSPQCCDLSLAIVCSSGSHLVAGERLHLGDGVVAAGEAQAHSGVVVQIAADAGQRHPASMPNCPSTAGSPMPERSSTTGEP